MIEFLIILRIPLRNGVMQIFANQNNAVDDDFCRNFIKMTTQTKTKANDEEIEIMAWIDVGVTVCLSIRLRLIDRWMVGSVHRSIHVSSFVTLHHLHTYTVTQQLTTNDSRKLLSFSLLLFNKLLHLFPRKGEGSPFAMEEELHSENVGGWSDKEFFRNRINSAENPLSRNGLPTQLMGVVTSY